MRLVNFFFKLTLIKKIVVYSYFFISPYLSLGQSLFQRSLGGEAAVSTVVQLYVTSKNRCLFIIISSIIKLLRT